MPFCRFISSLLLLPLSALVGARIVEFGQKLNEADWTVSSTDKQCRLSQNIPLYGNVEFEQKYRDQTLFFNLYINSIPTTKIMAKLTSIPSEWDHVTLRRPITKVELQTKNKTLTLENKFSRQIISELEDGMFPTLSYLSWTDEQHNVVVSISPINFRERLPKFLACISSLPLQPVVVKPKPKPIIISKLKSKPIKVTKIEDDPNPQTLYFAANSAKLDSIAKNKLKILLIKLKKDNKKKHVIVSGYSDDTGNKTQSTAISKQRALNVQAYLEQLGLPAKSLFTRYFGRDHAILSNSTAKGRAKNRRVHIDIIKSNLKSAR